MISWNLKKLYVNKAIRHVILMRERWNLVCHFLSYASMKQKKLLKIYTPVVGIRHHEVYAISWCHIWTTSQYFFIHFSHRVDILNSKWNSKGELFTCLNTIMISSFLNCMWTCALLWVKRLIHFDLRPLKTVLISMWTELK